MMFPGSSGLLVIALITLCEVDARAMGKTTKSNDANDLPNEGDEWMLHTPGGGPLDSRCPCLPSGICPRAFGQSPTDVLLLGHLPICKDESKVRCCGASFSITTGSLSTEVNGTRIKNSSDTIEHENSSRNVESGVLKDSNDQLLSPLPKEYSDENDIEDTINIVETTEESAMTTDAWQDIEGQTVRTMIDEYNDEAVHVTSPTNENDTDTLTTMSHSLNQSENSDMVYIENLRPDIILFQHAKEFIQESEGGNIMVVTPIPLTPRAKYQQQQKSTRGDTQLSIEIDPSYIHNKDFMYITHRPEGEVMVITPLSVEEETLVTQLSLPPDVRSGNKSSPPSQEEQPEAHHDVTVQPIGPTTNAEEFTEDNMPVLSSEMPVEEMREKPLTGVDLYPLEMENPRVIDSISGQGPITTVIASNTGGAPKEIQHVTATVKDTQNFANVQGNVGKGLRASQITVRNSKRPTKTRGVPRHAGAWSPIRIRAREPENLDTSYSLQQGTHFEGGKSFFHSEDGMYLSTTNKPIPMQSISVMIQENRNTNPILQDSPSTTSIKYVPVAVNKIHKLKLQPMFTHPVPLRIPNTLVDRQHSLIEGQETLIHRTVDLNNEARIFGDKVAMNEKLTKKGFDTQEMRRRGQDTLYHELSSLQTGLRQLLGKNVDAVQTKRVNIENKAGDIVNVKTGLLHPSQQFHTIDNVHISKYHDEIFGKKILPY